MKKKTIYILSALAFLTVGVFFYQNFSARSASYSFFQTDWSGGASLTATATHPGDSSGWDKYYSADSTIATDTPGQISLNSTSTSWTQTSDADFDQGTYSSVYATSGKIVLLKPDGVACTYNYECIEGICSDGYCSACGDNLSYSGQSYATVQIGEQCWMAENLNIGTRVDSESTGSSHSDVSDNETIEKYCYGNDENNCDAYGGIYDWNEMMGYTTTEGAQGICPLGWHIPTDAEFYELEIFLSTGSCTSNRISSYECSPAGTNLKEGGSTGFNLGIFGGRHQNGHFYYFNLLGDIWTSSGSGSDATLRVVSPSESGVDRLVLNKNYGFSVRCIRD